MKVRAAEAGLRVLEPDRVDDSLVPQLRELAPDVATVVAFGRILPRSVLESVPLGFVNVHFSALPLLRGAAPVQRALIEGMTETGVSIMVLSEGMDEGPVLALERVAIRPEDNAGTLGARLAQVGATLLPPTLEAYAEGRLVPEPQDDSRATYAPRVKPDETRLDWNDPAVRLANLVRGLAPEPGAWSTFRSRRLKVLEATAAEDGLNPGELGGGPEAKVGTGQGALLLQSVQPAGKRPMSGPEWVRGVRPEPREQLA